jgi:hypothetical protein
MKPWWRKHILFMVLALVMAGTPLLLWSASKAVRADAPPWVEPRALNVVDLAGQVPDEVLRDHLVAYGAGGISRYVSSQWQGNLLRITVRLDTRRLQEGSNWVTTLELLGQKPIFDHMGSATPESWLRLYEGASEITSQVTGAQIVDAALRWPLASAASAERYPQSVVWSLPSEEEGRRIPANYGGRAIINGDHPVLTGVFTVEPASRPRVTYLGQQQATFQSYIGVGGVGLFQPLMAQLRGRYGDRHPRIPLSIPEGANYVVFVYPPMPFDAYDGTGNNLQRPVGGTVRLAPDEGMLSQDLMHGGAFPLRVAWQDADQSAGPYLSLLPPINRITPPEYVVPAGVAYNACFLQGNCSDSILRQIYEATMSMRIVYLRVDTPYEGIEALPLRVADETWTVGARAPQQGKRGLDSMSERIYLPLLRSYRLRPERPLGFFDASSGRMLGYLAP